MSKLVNIPQIDQNELLGTYKLSIAEKENVLVLGPSGAGKTDMCFQACAALNKNMIYWNMSVMERPDIMGIPVTHADRLTSTFAPNQGMPFVGLEAIKDSRSLSYIIDSIKNSNTEFGYFLETSKSKLAELNRTRLISTIKDCSSFFDAEELVRIGADINIVGNENSRNVLVLDEIDKTPPENMQPLLELLLYKKMNGEPLDIQSVIMTGNLPDEQSYSNPLSHAITNRAMVYELVPDPSIWLKWGFENGVHTLVRGFLSRKEQAAEYFNKRPANNDTYSYAYSSPRSWTTVSRILHKYEKYEKEHDPKVREIFSDILNPSFRKKLIASNIGSEAATNLDVWFSFYKEYDSLIDAVCRGENPTGPTDGIAQIVVSIAIANNFIHSARTSDDTKSVQKNASHVFNWIGNNSPEDAKICAFRACYDEKTFLRHGFDTYTDTANIWSEIVKTQEALTALPEDKL